MDRRSRLRRPLVAFLVVLLAAGAGPAPGQAPGASAPLRLPRLFQDGMVLQRGARIPVWGWAAPGTAVTVALNGRAEHAVADRAGAWRVRFPALQAGGPHALMVEGAGTRVVIRDVRVGDVWVASGQSNMAWPLASAASGPAAVATARDHLLREFAVPRSWSENPERDLAGGSWATADPEHAGKFSAVAYFFAHDLRAETGVPIGIIHASWGGAGIEAWMSRRALGIGDSAWAARVRGERAREAAARDSLRAPIDGQRIDLPSVLYNRMIHPLLPYPIRGVIWYQGESNAGDEAQAAAYRPLFAGLIRSWRREWAGGSGDFPFLWVQLPSFGAVDSVPPASAAWATLRESQTAALELPQTGQVVAIDLGDPGDLHPRDKEPVGQRLARVARRVSYGEPIVASGPTYRRHEVRGGLVWLEFDDVGGGLVSRSVGEGVGGFAVAGADRRWVWAEARIEGKRVVVWSPQVPKPAAVRYAWSNSPKDPGLYNREGLPARPFRTDRW